MSVLTGTAPAPLLQAAAARLAAAGLPAARAEAEWLLAAVLGLERGRLLVDPPPVTPAQAARFEALVGRRAAREPLQHLLGWEDFHGLRLRVTPAALIPRPETEGLVAWVLELLAGSAGRPLRLADVGTGSGAIACALARALPGATVVAVDRSAPALALARRNVRALGLQGRVHLVRADLLAGVRGGFDAVVANLPYLPTGGLELLPDEVRRFEPREALDGGPDGLAVIERLVAAAPAVLAPGGLLVLEVGDDQAAAVAARLGRAGLGALGTRRDLAGVPRYVAGRRG